jgi:hypothetical protein
MHETPGHTDHPRDQLAGPFAHWRRTRSHPAERMPQCLWTQAAALARVLPSCRVAQHLRLSPRDLQKHLATPPDSRSVPTSGFIEVPPTPGRPPAPQGMESELERPDGTRLHVRGPETTSSVTAWGQAFVEVAR